MGVGPWGGLVLSIQHIYERCRVARGPRSKEWRSDQKVLSLGYTAAATPSVLRNAPKKSLSWCKTRFSSVCQHQTFPGSLPEAAQKPHSERVPVHHKFRRSRRSEGVDLRLPRTRLWFTSNYSTGTPGTRHTPETQLHPLAGRSARHWSQEWKPAWARTGLWDWCRWVEHLYLGHTQKMVM